MFNNVKVLTVYSYHWSELRGRYFCLMSLNKLHSTILCILPTLFLCLILESLTWKLFPSLVLWKLGFWVIDLPWRLKLHISYSCYSEIKKGPSTSFLPALTISRSDVQGSVLPALSAVQTEDLPHSFVCEGSTGLRKKVLSFISLDKTLTVSHTFLPA